MRQLDAIYSTIFNDVELKTQLIVNVFSKEPELLLANPAYIIICKLKQETGDPASDDVALLKAFERAKNRLIRHTDAIKQSFALKDKTVHDIVAMLLEAIERFIDEAQLILQTVRQPKPVKHIVFSHTARQEMRRLYILGDGRGDANTGAFASGNALSYYHGLAPEGHKHKIKYGRFDGIFKESNWFFDPAGYEQATTVDVKGQPVQLQERGAMGLLDGTRNNLFKQFNAQGLEPEILEKLMRCYATDESILATIKCTAGQTLMQSFPGVCRVPDHFHAHAADDSEYEKSNDYHVFQWAQVIDLVTGQIQILEYHYVLYTQASAPLFGFAINKESGDFEPIAMAGIEEIRAAISVVDDFLPDVLEKDLLSNGHVDVDVDVDVVDKPASELPKSENRITESERELIDELIKAYEPEKRDEKRIAEIKQSLAATAAESRHQWNARLTTLNQQYPPLMKVEVELKVVPIATCERIQQKVKGHVSFDITHMRLDLYHKSLIYRGVRYHRDQIKLRDIAGNLRLVTMQPNAWSAARSQSNSPVAEPVESTVQQPPKL